MVWSDALGTVGMVLNQDGRPAPGEPLSPGMSPCTNHFIVNYSSYVPLTQWETIKDTLNRERMPCIRDCVDDYLPARKEAWQGGSTPPPSSAAAFAPAKEYLQSGQRDLRSGGGCSSARSRNVPAAALDISFAPPSPLTVSEIASNSDAAARRFAPQAPLSARERPSTSDSAAKMLARIRAQQQFAWADEEPRAQTAQSPSKLQKLLDAMPYDDEQGGFTRVVRPNAVPGARPEPGRKRRVADRDTDKNVSGRQMKPMRQLNMSSKKRLNELLKLPAGPDMRLEALEAHSSRAYGLIPTQNLRVARP